jgi:hypothetical protein
MPEIVPGSRVVLTVLPPGLIDGLPATDQAAIRAIVGQPVTLAGYSHGQAELEFGDPAGSSHTIWVDSALIHAA